MILKTQLMRTILTIFILFISFSAFSQEKEISKSDSLKESQHFNYDLGEPTQYKLNEQQFTFTPEMNLIHIKTSKDSGEIDYADLRRTTDDGLYIMTSTTSDQVSFGRFDSIGNFRTLRYDTEKDSVVEEWYMKEPPTKVDPEK